MIRGLVIGKFMPVHLGHIALINFAADRCDELIVSMSYTPNDPIDGQLRFSWLKKIFHDRPSIKISKVVDDFDNETLPWPSRTKLWSDFIQKTYPPVHVLFSSEEYGDPFAKNLGVDHVSFDQQRSRNPVSGSLIRLHPFLYWDFIPTVVRPYFVKKICFYGPESTGKSTMAGLMAEHYQTEFVPEVAREMITSNDFTVDDIIHIGHAHVNRIQEKTKIANKILFCDTDAITTQIYSQHYLNEVPPVLFELEKQIHYDHYFIFDIDVPWIDDGLRDLGAKRKEMFLVFKEQLDKRNIPYTLIQGNWGTRFEKIRKIIDESFFN